MSREFKFRAWDIRLKTFIFFDLSTYNRDYWTVNNQDPDEFLK